jgi:hypothetical protein
MEHVFFCEVSGFVCSGDIFLQLPLFDGNCAFNGEAACARDDHNNNSVPSFLPGT